MTGKMTKQISDQISKRGSIRAIIVDDEPLARRKIRSLVRSDPEIEVVAECGNCPEAVAEIRRLNPDLVFLDVQMPGMDGFGLLQTLSPNGPPFVVFVTAYDHYALRAFEFSAFDYLLKPVDRKRFQLTIAKVKDRIRKDEFAEARTPGSRLPTAAHRGTSYLERLPIPADGRLVLLKTDDIDWIEASGKYVAVHAGPGKHLLREAIGAIESQLDPRKFIRIHRSFIVNIDRIQELQPWFHHEYRAVLKDGTRLTVSRSFKSHLASALGDLI